MLMKRGKVLVLSACALLLCGQGLVASAQADPLAGAVDRRFILRSADGEYTMRLTGRVHFKGQFPLDGPASDADDSYLQLRRIRTGVEGKLAKYYQYKIEYDFGRDSAVLTDGYLGLTHFGGANLRMGRYKVPFSVEELTSSNSIRFVERSLINRFAPSRMIGASVIGSSGNVGYHLGAFDGAVDGSYLFAGRLTLDVEKVTIGFNALSEDNEGSGSLLDFRSGHGTRWYRYDADLVSGGSRTQIGADVGFWGAPFHFQGEFVMGDQDVVLDEAGRSLGHTGFTVQAGYVLTGEKASVGGVTPARDFDREKGGKGAFELMARYSQITTDDAAMDFARSGSVRSASEITAGLNWYMSRHAKLVLNYVHTSFDSEVAGSDGESGVLVRMQLNY
jgi:phosphate-selective porin OprO and OprP